MKILLDQDLCQCHGVCTAEAPEIFELDDDGKLMLLNERPNASQRDAVQAAVQYCPTSALSIQDD